MIDSYKTDYPELNNDNSITLENGITVYNCTIQENKNIKGFVIDTDSNIEIKALYNVNKSSWFFGSNNIKKSFLVPLNQRSKEERILIAKQGNAKLTQRREEKKNFNELAKAMLEQTVTEEQIKTVLGDNTEMLLDNSVASVILASMIQGAVNGSFKCAEFVRDTAGYKPKNEVEVSADIMTEADRSLIDKLSKRIG